MAGAETRSRRGCARSALAIARLPSLDARLQQRGVPAASALDALATLERIGYVDDERFACTRAESLAERGSGDALIRHDLERRGLAAEHVEAALADKSKMSVSARRESSGDGVRA